jgi:cytochrome c
MRTWVIAGVFVLASTGATLAQDAAAGQMLFNSKGCIACHAIGENAQIKLGPPLNGIEGRKAGTYEGFTNYSDGLKNSGIVWDKAKFAQWIASPQAMVPGTRMAFAGDKDETEVANIWAYVSGFKADGSKK